MPKLWQEEARSSEKNWAEEMSSKLANGLVRKKLVNRMPKIRAWIKTFNYMVSQDKLKEGEISKTLDWYIAHAGEEYVPEILSASTFRAKYQRLRSKMDRSMEVALGSEAKEIYKSATKRGLLAGLDHHLSAIIQKSLDAYRPFWAKVCLFEIPEDCMIWHQDPLIRLLAHLLAIQALNNPKRFVTTWVEYIHAELSTKNSWDTDPNQLVWSHASYRWDRTMFSRTYDFCQDTGRWSLLKEEILKKGTA